MPSALVLLAEGAEEMEAVIAIDVLRRAGIEVTVAGVAGVEPVTCSRGVKLVPDVSLDLVKDKLFDAVVCPGGAGGALNLSQSATVGEILRKQIEGKRLLGAICAGPTCLLAHNVCKGMQLTSHPGVKDKLSGDYMYTEERVVKDQHLITSRGPGTGLEFALALVEQLCGKEKRDEIAPPMILNF